MTASMSTVMTHRLDCSPSRVMLATTVSLDVKRALIVLPSIQRPAIATIVHENSGGVRRCSDPLSSPEQSLNRFDLLTARMHVYACTSRL